MSLKDEQLFGPMILRANVDILQYTMYIYYPGVQVHVLIFIDVYHNHSNLHTFVDHERTTDDLLNCLATAESLNVQATVSRRAEALR